MGKYWAKIAQIVDFVGELLLGFIVRFLRDEGVAVRGCGTTIGPGALRRQAETMQRCYDKSS